MLKTSSVCPLVINQSWSSSMHATFLKSLQQFPFTYQTHHLIVVIQTETFQRLSTNKQATRRKNKKKQKYKERREKTHQLSIWGTTSFVPSLSFLSHLLRWTESLPPLSRSLWDDCFTEVPGDTFFLFLSSSQWLLFS